MGRLYTQHVQRGRELRNLAQAEEDRRKRLDGALTWALEDGVNKEEYGTVPRDHLREILFEIRKLRGRIVFLEDRGKNR